MPEETHLTWGGLGGPSEAGGSWDLKDTEGHPHGEWGCRAQSGRPQAEKCFACSPFTEVRKLGPGVGRCDSPKV